MVLNSQRSLIVWPLFPWFTTAQAYFVRNMQSFLKKILFFKFYSIYLLLKILINEKYF